MDFERTTMAPMAPMAAMMLAITPVPQLAPLRLRLEQSGLNGGDRVEHLGT